LVVRAAALERVNASYGAISGSMAQTWVAKEARLYEKYGVDLNLVYISGGPRSIMSLIGGTIGTTETGLGIIKVVFDAIRQLMTPPEPNKRKIGFLVKERVPRYGRA
jgi:hypothetical protein